MIPVNATEWTRYEVADVDGKVTVSAFKNDVNINSRSVRPEREKQAANSSHATVREGEQKTRDEKCGAAEIKQATTSPALGAVMNSPWARGAGLAAIGVLTCWALCRTDEPVSPSHP